MTTQKTAIKDTSAEQSNNTQSKERQSAAEKITSQQTDILIVGAGPVGLMCSYLSQLCGLRTMVVDASEGPLEVGRADALNARTLQLLEISGQFYELYPMGKPCNTSKVWSNGKFI